MTQNSDPRFTPPIHHPAPPAPGVADRQEGLRRCESLRWKIRAVHTLGRSYRALAEHHYDCIRDLNWAETPKTLFRVAFDYATLKLREREEWASTNSESLLRSELDEITSFVADIETLTLAGIRDRGLSPADAITAYIYQNREHDTSWVGDAVRKMMSRKTKNKEGLVAFLDDLKGFGEQ